MRNRNISTFHGPGHNGIQGLSVQLIDKVTHERDLLDKEGQWAYRLKCIKPHGLNENDFSFQIQIVTCMLVACNAFYRPFTLM